MSASDELDEQRLEWEFETLRRDHVTCCTGAILLRGEAGPMWLNVICPVDDSSYRAFDTGDSAATKELPLPLSERKH